MRPRVFSARTLGEAMAALRRELGDDAVILATEEGAEGARITAAVEQPGEALDAILDLATPLPVIERLALALRFHQAGGRRIERLCLSARQSGAAEPAEVLASALAGHYGFAPLGRACQGPIILAGAAGAGKTLMAARLAAMARLAGRPVRVASTDTGRCCGLAQLEALLKAMGVALEPVSALMRKDGSLVRHALTLIDTAAVNPLRPETLAEPAVLASRLQGELLPVLPAELMPSEAHDQALAWQALGARRFLVSRLDAARRLGTLLAAADAGLAFAGAAIAPTVAEPVRDLTALNLARLLMHRAASFAGEAAA